MDRRFGKRRGGLVVERRFIISRGDLLCGKEVWYVNRRFGIWRGCLLYGKEVSYVDRRFAMWERGLA